MASPAPTATFKNDGPYVQGQPASVFFVNPKGSGGVFFYSFDFNNDGIFEVYNGFESSAAVPSQYIINGRKIKGRIGDKFNKFTDYTTTLVINSAPPIPIPPTPTGLAVVPGDAMTSLTWNVSTGAVSYKVYRGLSSGSETFLQLINATSYVDNGLTNDTKYFYQITAVNTSGESAKSTEVSATPIAPPPPPIPTETIITVAGDEIPNFGSSPTIKSVTSGNWSAPTTWDLGRVPAANDIVSVLNTVTYDVLSDEKLNTIAVQAGATLKWKTDVNTRLRVTHFLGMRDSSIIIGDETTPILSSKAEIIINNVPLNGSVDPEQYGNGLIALGKLRSCGNPKIGFVRLTKEPLVGDTTLLLAQAGLNWVVGDRLALPDSRQLHQGETWSQFVPQWEMATISAISADGKTLTLAAPLVYNHPGGGDGEGIVDSFPHVMNLTRNVIVRSESASGTRGWVFFTEYADVECVNTQFSALGRTTQEAIDNSTFDANELLTHFGTNQDQRFPVSVMHYYGKASKEYTYKLQGCSVFCPLNPMPFLWGITLFDAHYGLVKDNVVYNWAGAGIISPPDWTFASSFNTIDGNIVCAVIGNTPPRHGTGKDGGAFWFNNWNNYIQNNVATSCSNTNQDIVMGVGYTLVMPPAGDMRRIPLAKGLNTITDGQFKGFNISSQGIPLTENNEVYGCCATGMTVWQLNWDFQNNPNGSTPFTVKNFKAWNCWEEGFFSYNFADMIFDGFTVRGWPSDYCGSGWVAGDYTADRAVIKNVDIQGCNHGIIGFMHTADSFLVENAFIKVDATALQTHIQMSPGAPTALKAPRVITYKDVEARPRKDSTRFTAIDMSYIDTYGGTNFTVSDKTFVTNYQKVVGDNFQVYYTQQAPDYITPQQTYYGPDDNNDGTPDWINCQGSPEAGLTNQQNMDKYGICIAGEISPTANTRPNISGFVRNI